MSLYAEYFTLPSRVSALGEIDFGASPTATGTVSRLATRYSEEGFWEGGPEDHFAARYTGQLHVKSGGTYTFFLTSDDGSALYINGERVINNDFMHGDIELQVALELGAGMHDIEIRYFDGGWDASLQLEWAGPDSDGQRQIIEGDAFVQKASEEDIDSGTAEDGTGPGDPGSEGTGDSTDSDNDSSQMSGLMARYFTVSGRISSLSDIDFDTTPTETGNVERLAMLRERGGFWEGGPRNKFAAHYAGSLNVESGGTYTFYLTSDDGSALYINGEPVIDNDGLHATREQRVTLELAAGAHDIEIFYFEYRGRASLQLEWAGPDSDGQRQVIEGEAFSHNGLDDDTTDTGDSGSDDTGGDTDTGDSGSDDTGGDTDTGDNGSDGTAGSLSDPSIGVGLTGVVDWSAENPFIDVFKSARDWIGHESGQWGGTSYQELLDAGALDENGWPTEIPSGVDRIGTHILTAQNAGATSLAGRYRLTYDGEGELSINGVNNIEYGDGEIWFEYIPGQSETVGIDILRTGSNGNHIRNISVVHEDNISAFEAGEIFNPNFVELIEDMRSLRFMDWMGTNNSTQSEWADRPQTDSFTWSEGAGGVPVEVMVELANLTGTDPWFNIPHLASQEYIENFATYVRDNLDPNLKAHFEYSNEVWNWMFEQTQWAGQMGEELWPGQPDAWLQYYALKSVEMAEILDRVYGAEAGDRLVKIIATQTGWPGLEEPILNAAQWLASDPDQDRAPHTYFDAYAVTGYFGGSLGSDKAATVRGWVVESIERATTDANALGLRGSEPIRPCDGVGGPGTSGWFHNG